MSRIWDVAEALLDAVSDAFATSADPPTYRWIADGSIPTLDFGLEDSLVVMWDGIRTGLAAEGLAGGEASAAARGLDQGSTLSATYSIYVWRPAPMPDDAGNGPSIDEIMDAARRQQDDAFLVAQTLVAGFGDGTILGSCGDANLLDQSPFGDGGVEGSRLRIAVGL